MSLTATYSPEDNKCRLRSLSRLDKELYDRVRAAGFIWAPKQELFVAPAWSPEREDLLVELCGEIGDEDTSLVDRAEERAERFEDYSEKRAGDAERAHAGVAAIADNIPLGQPLLVGHHSYKRAKKDAERIENGMRKAVKMWETSTYWTQRAKGALRHAKYKELPAVRHRRIKGLESELRKHRKATAEAQDYLVRWEKVDLTREATMAIANYDHATVQEEGLTYRSSLWSMLSEGKIEPAKAADHAIARHQRMIAWRARWIAHLENRLAYERAMLGEQGGVAASKFDLEIGGRVLIRREWLVIIRLNKVGGAVASVTTAGGRFWDGVRGVEEIEDYRAPAPGDAEKVKAKTKLPPLVNYPAPGCREMTQAEWTRATKCSDSYRTYLVKATETHGAHRRREAPAGGWETKWVYITDAKRVDPPALGAPSEPVTFEREVEPRDVPAAPRAPSVAQTRAAELREQLKAGVHVVAVEQLFETPPELATLVVGRADVFGQEVLEPSAGLGALVKEALRCHAKSVRSFEINERCCEVLRTMKYERGSHNPCDPIDFLAIIPSRTYPRIIMNPPFADGQDVAHVTKAFVDHLSPGGRLVAIMSAGVKFRMDKKYEDFRRIIATRGKLEDLPDGSFKSSGTNVSTALVVLEKL